MLRNCWPGHRKSLSDPSGGQFLLPQQVQHRATSRVGKRAENSFPVICNHAVTHNA